MIDHVTANNLALPTSQAGLSLLRSVKAGKKNTFLFRFCRDRADLLERGSFYPVLSYHISLVFQNLEEEKSKEFLFSEGQPPDKPIALLLRWHDGQLEFDLAGYVEYEITPGRVVELTGFVEYFDTQENVEKVISFTRFWGENGSGLFFRFEKTGVPYGHFEEENF